jgi:KaiC/GvpD/RAD55 family RecA-like ATPase
MSDDADFDIVRTGVSEAFWCDPVALKFERATLPTMSSHQTSSQALTHASWLDHLLGGGLVLPKSANKSSTGVSRALTVLLTGPPGTGKSTLATELCYRWAQGTDAPLPFRTYYATTEAYPPWLIANSRRLWGTKIDAAFKRITVAEYSAADDSVPLVHTGRVGTSVEKALESVAQLLGLSLRKPVSFQDDPYHVIVIDSLNVVPDEEKKANLFQKLFNLILGGPRIVIFILDSTPGDASKVAEFWEYICDVVIRLDHSRPHTPEGYMLRTIEIVKARYQRHAWGVHQLKLYEANEARQRNEKGQAYRDRLIRAHPFREEGGIFIYPSIHYLLSLYKRSDPASDPKLVQTPIPSFSAMLEGGFPEERCTAFLGVRGGHKSYLGFMQVVSRILDHGECGLIVSLRDDVGITKQSIDKILVQGWPERKQKSKLKQADCKRIWESDLRKRLEIMYFPPGNITPDEFLHRILVSVKRLQQYKKDQPITLLFNSVDQLGPRFPLCAKEPMFIAALLQILSAERVTSVFVAASEARESTANYHGIESIAELILEFTHDTQQNNELKTQALLRAIKNPIRDPMPSIKTWLSGRGNRNVMVQVMRHAGGHAAGAHAIVEFVDANHPLRDFFSEGPQLIPLDIH